MLTVVRYSGHYNLILRTIQYYIPKLSYSNDIQQGSVKMSQKNENNSANPIAKIPQVRNPETKKDEQQHTKK